MNRTQQLAQWAAESAQRARDKAKAAHHADQWPRLILLLQRAEYAAKHARSDEALLPLRRRSLRLMRHVWRTKAPYDLTAFLAVDADRRRETPQKRRTPRYEPLNDPRECAVCAAPTRGAWVVPSLRWTRPYCRDHEQDGRANVIALLQAAHPETVYTLRQQ